MFAVHTMLPTPSPRRFAEDVTCSSCAVGWTDKGDTDCEDVDECIDYPCGVGGYCANSPGSYTCNCMVGYKHAGPREACVLNDMCEDDPCPGGEHCINLKGAYYCVPIAIPSQLDTQLTSNAERTITIAYVCGLVVLYGVV